jgi:hypothetical protein
MGASDLYHPVSRSKASRRERVSYLDSPGIRRYRARTRPEGGASNRVRVLPRRGPLFEVPAQEIHLLTLWVRTWGEKFEVELDADPDTDGEGMIAGRVSCLWNDGPGGHRPRRSRRAGTAQVFA